MKPTILLTGKTGQLGSELNRLLPRLGEVVAPERTELDLREPKKICEIMGNVKPQLVINAAAYAAVDAAETDQASAYAVNADAPRLLALEAKNFGAMLVHFSSDYVFDGAKKAPYVETDSPNPLNAYGRTKLAGEQAIRDSGVLHLIFRTSWVYATHGRNFLLTILRLATQREELSIVCDQIGAPTCAHDIAVATTKILTAIYRQDECRRSISSLSGTYHMTAAGETSWYNFAKAILEGTPTISRDVGWFAAATQGRPLIAKHIVPIPSEEFRSPTRRPNYSVLSNSRLTQTFEVSLSDWATQLQCCIGARNAERASI